MNRGCPRPVPAVGRVWRRNVLYARNPVVFGIFRGRHRQCKVYLGTISQLSQGNAPSSFLQPVARLYILYVHYQSLSSVSVAGTRGVGRDRSPGANERSTDDRLIGQTVNEYQEASPHGQGLASSGCPEMLDFGPGNPQSVWGWGSHLMKARPMWFSMILTALVRPNAWVMA